MKIKETFAQIALRLQNSNDRSAWDKGVNEYAIELLEAHEENYGAESPTIAQLLNGASD
jgi:hypothetical protein